MKRLFLGISPDKEQIENLISFQLQLSENNLVTAARAVNPANFHMTLSFIGPVSAHVLPQLIEDIDKVSEASGWPRFNVTFDTLTHWQKPQVLCLSAPTLAHSRIDPALRFTVNHCQAITNQLVSVENNHSESVKIALNKNRVQAREFTPHITLFRKAKQMNIGNLTHVSTPPISLQPSQLHLYQSISGSGGVEYPILHSWPLLGT